MVRTVNATILSAYPAASDSAHTDKMTHTNAADSAAADVGEATHSLDAAAHTVDTANPDAADATDTDIQEYLSSIPASNLGQGRSINVHSFSPPRTPEQLLADTPSLLPEISVQHHSNNPGAPLQLVIDQFPYGCPGAPIPGSPHGTPVYQATQDNFGAFWFPFCSQTDWEVVHWAKLSGTSSSALTELFTIPNVCDHAFLITLLMHGQSLLTSLTCRTPLPMDSMQSLTGSCLGAHLSKPKIWSLLMKRSHCITRT